PVRLAKQPRLGYSALKDPCTANAFTHTFEGFAEVIDSGADLDQLDTNMSQALLLQPVEFCQQFLLLRTSHGPALLPYSSWISETSPAKMASWPRNSNSFGKSTTQ
ncbi:unnamed protein product, partial [Polarella glacialis]